MGGITALASFDDGQLVMEINGSPNVIDAISFTAVENESDMERRHRRIVRILDYCGVDRSALAILAGPKSFYVAAEIERVLPWPLSIFLCDSDSEPDRQLALSRLGTNACILAADHLPRIDAYGTRITLNQLGRQTPIPEGKPEFDVICLSVVPWFAVSEGDGVYRTLDTVAIDSDDESQFYLEQGPQDTLVVTALPTAAGAGAIPIVRYDTHLQITAVDPVSFVVPIRTNG